MTANAMKIYIFGLGVMAHTYNRSTPKTQASALPRQVGAKHRETLPQNQSTGQAKQKPPPHTHTAHSVSPL